MKIVNIELIHLAGPPFSRPLRPAWTPGGARASWTACLVRIATDKGLVGWGSIRPEEASAVEAWVKPQLIGKDPFALEQHARVFRNAGGGWGAEIALWDIIGQAAGQPLYRLWGAHKDRVPGYASCIEVRSGAQRADWADERERLWRSWRDRIDRTATPMSEFRTWLRAGSPF